MSDIISTYFPTFSEIPNEDVLNMRARLEALLRQGWPDIDYRVNSPLGDLGLTPLAYMLCASEVAMNRFMSDLDLENVAKGVIYNCPFVTKFLQNFAITARETLQSSGIVRLTFIKDDTFEINRRAQYQFGADTFRIRLPHDGPLVIKPVGTPLTAGANNRNLVELTPGLWVVDVPVVGVMSAQILAGTTGTTDFVIDELSEIAALVDFDFGLPPASLSELAAKTRETFYSSTPNTRGGAARFLTKEFPELVGVSPVQNGDVEMVRDSVNALGLSTGKLDLFVQSKSTVEESQVVKIPFKNTLGSDGVFVTKLSLAGIPNALVSIVANGAPTVDLTSHVTIFSESRNSAIAPMATAAYTEHEDLWLTITMPVSGSDNVIPLDIDGGGAESALFTVKYSYDPLLQPVIDTVGSSQVTPPGVGVLARGFIPIVIDSLTVSYTRRRGTTVNIDQAREEILTYLNHLSLPRRYADTKVADTMFYAGAEDVLDIACQAHVQWGLADLYIPNGTDNPGDDYDDALANSLAPHPISITSSKGFVPGYVDVNLGTANATYEACGLRNIVLRISEDNLFFNEVAQ